MNASRNKLPNSRLPVLIASGLVSLIILAAWIWSALSSPTVLKATTTYSTLAISPVPLQSSTASPSPDGQYNVQALRATTEAIARSLPTIAPNPNFPPDKGAGFAQNQVIDIAFATAITLYPPPPGYFPPTPTAAPLQYPKPTPAMRAAGAGTIYDEGGIQNGEIAHVIHAMNVWSETIDHHDIIVYAGFPANTLDASRGMLLIATQDSSTYELIGERERYESPTHHGYLRIVDAVGERLVLRANDGTMMGFDVSTRQWVSLTPQPSPSVTSRPSPSAVGLP